MNNPHTVETYIAQFPAPIQEICHAIRTAILSAAPDATEKISYGIPTYYLGENLIHFGVMKNHIGLYPTSDGVTAFAERLSEYQTSKGTIQFPLSRPIPYDLIREITAYRVRQMQNKRAKQR